MLASAKEMGAYISLAHPFAFGRKSLDYQHGRRGKPFVESVMEAVDAIELYNGGIHRQANRKAKEYAFTAGKRLTVGSDSHRLGTIGSCGTYLRPAAENESSRDVRLAEDGRRLAIQNEGERVDHDDPDVRSHRAQARTSFRARNSASHESVGYGQRDSKSENCRPPLL